MTDYVTSCTMKIDHLIADVVCIFVYFLILMWATLCWCWWWLWEIKITVYLTALPPCPGHPHWPGSYHWTPSPQSFHLPMCVLAGSPLSWSHHLSPHWGQGDIHELTFWSSLTQRRRSIIWTWSLWKMELVLLTRDLTWLGLVPDLIICTYVWPTTIVCKHISTGKAAPFLITF